MRRLLALLPLAALLGCPQTPWCDRLNPDQPDRLQTCVYADEVYGSRPFSTDDGYPVDFVAPPPDERPDQAELADGTTLTGRPWGIEWQSPTGGSSPVRAHSLGTVAAVEAAPDESRYAIGLGDGRFLVRSMGHATLLDGRAVDADLEPGVRNAMVRFAFSSDGALLVTGDRRGNVNLWAPGAGGHRWHATPTRPARSLAVSPDGRHVAAGSDDGVVTVWEAATGRQVAAWTHPNAVKNVEFTPTGEHVVARIGGAVHVVDRPPNADGADGESVEHTHPDVVAVWRLP